MSFLDLAKARSSVRKYTSRKVEPETMNIILEAARVAPTAANRQPVRLLVVQEESALAKVGKAAAIFDAPLVVVVLADHSKAWRRSFDGKVTTDIDASILTDHMMLAAADLGLGSVWVCWFKPDVLKREFAIPDNLEPINILALGYSAETPADPERHAQTRVPLSDLVRYDTL